MSKTIFDVKLSEILPQSIRGDSQVAAAAKSIDALVQNISAQTKLVNHIPRIDELPTDVLDHLAYQLHADFWHVDFSEDVKRDQLRESIFWHRIKGTPAGVEKAVDTFLHRAKVEEFWEYESLGPYYFRITTRGLKFLSHETEFLDLIDCAKNVRSWLEGIIFDLTIEEPHELFHAIGEGSGGLHEVGVNIPTLDNQHNLAHAIAELESGFIEIGFGGTEKAKSQLYHAIAELEGGFETVDSYFTPPPDDFWLERWLIEQWREWKLNPIYHQYPHPDDGEIDPFDPDFPPLEGNFLHLFFRYPHGKYKFLTLTNPREDLTAAEVKALGVQSSGLFKGSNGELSTGLARAFITRRDTFKIL